MLEVNDLHKTFNIGTINEKVALDGVNLKLNSGDFVTIIGGNGAPQRHQLPSRLLEKSDPDRVRTDDLRRDRAAL